jgi:acyl-CoA synthetase (AMP-forming)/AMP-acid ligase II
MADLVPLQQIADLTGLLNAPYINSFGATETGLAPASGALLAPGSGAHQPGQARVGVLQPAPGRYRRPRRAGGHARRSRAARADAVLGLLERARANAHDFRGGWFHMGDLFVRRADGTLDFVDRAKYLIKSGGENIYPAEIERVLLAEAGGGRRRRGAPAR